MWLKETGKTDMNSYEKKKERSVSILGFKSLSMRLEDSWTQHRIYDEVGTAVASGRKLLLFFQNT